MTVIKPLTETTDTVTLRRVDYETLLAGAEDALDRAALRSFDDAVAQQGIAAVKAEMLPAALLDRLLQGASPVSVWRQHRGLTQRALAAAAGVSVSYLNEIEQGRKPGSAATLGKLAAVLRLRIEDLLPPAE